MIRAVFFDAGHTLIHPYPGVEEVCFRVFSRCDWQVPERDLRRAVELSEEYYQENYKKDDTFWASEVAAAEFWAGYYANIAEICGAGRESRALAEEMYDEFGSPGSWKPFPDARPALESMKKLNLVLGVVSNWDTRLSEILVSHGFGEFFDFVVASARVGFIKPQAEIFNIALGRAGVNAEEAIHVGDHFYADVLGARTAGVTPVLLDRSQSWALDECHTVKELTELIDLIARHA